MGRTGWIAHHPGRNLVPNGKSVGLSANRGGETTGDDVFDAAQRIPGLSRWKVESSGQLGSGPRSPCREDHGANDDQAAFLQTR